MSTFKKYATTNQICQRIEAITVCQPHWKIPIHDFALIVKKSNCESCNLICKSQIITSNHASTIHLHEACLKYILQP